MPIEQPLTPQIAAALAAEVYELEDKAAGSPFEPIQGPLRNAFDFSQYGGAKVVMLLVSFVTTLLLQLYHILI